MKYIGEITVNGFPGIESGEKPFYEEPRMPKDLITRTDYVTAKNVLDAKVPMLWSNGSKDRKICC